MKSIIKLALMSFLFSSSQVFAEKMLAPPHFDSAPECFESYNRAAQPKTADAVLSSMNVVCQGREGLRVLHKILGDPRYPTNVIFSCIGDNPNKRIFSCLFSTSYDDL